MTISRFLYGLAAILVCSGLWVSALAAELPAHKANLLVGVGHVIPPFVGGSKVRTPESIETALAEQLAQHLGMQLETIAAAPASRLPVLRAAQPDLVLGTAQSIELDYPGATMVATGYVLSPMAIMRSDTQIKTWAQLQGRTVCLSEGSPYAGTMTSQYGAVEKLFAAPADSLLALRTGSCDAAVHDSATLNELLKLPEWKKFSARLSSDTRVPLVFAASSQDSATIQLLNRVAGQWKAKRYLADLSKGRARDIAFEVYLDQNIPDCH
jgi:polar amino acid transport system substrate-binding protein